jgi:hypothetical protein
MKSLFTLSVIILVFIHGINLGQEKKGERNFIYLEIGGNQVIYSLNYEYEILNQTNVRLGTALLPIEQFSNSGRGTFPYLFITLMANRFFNIKKNHYIEFGGGMTYGDEKIVPTLAIGYRYIPNEEGLILKITYTPLFGTEFETWFGIGIGWKF